MPAGKARSYVYPLQLAAVFAAYFITGKIGLTFEAVNGFASLVWPPTGIAIAVVLLYGRKFWPAIAAAAFAVNLLSGASLGVAAGIALGNTLEALLASWLLISDGKFRITLEDPRSVLAFVGLGAGLSTLVSATFGATSLWLGGLATVQTYAGTWTSWWIGDAFGALIVAPFLLVWLGRRLVIGRFAGGGTEVLAMLVIFSGVAAFMYGDGAALLAPQAASYVMMIPLVWAGVRFGMRGATATILSFTLISVYATALGRGPFAAGDLNVGIAALQLFVGASALMALFLGSAHDERILADQSRQDLRQEAEEQARYLKSIVDLAPVGIKLLDRTSRVLEINGAGLRMLGAASERELKDRPILAMIEPDDRPAFDALLKKVFEEKGSGGLRHALLALNGARRVLDVKMVPFYQTDGKISAALAMFDDKTKEVEQERQLKANYEDMQQLNKSLVGRELKMIEMKKDLQKSRGGKDA